ncbi:MAG: DUF547 domain-containing protein [Crocinitomicaceae bacterium]|nr:DUF547 domain-containing protein [Crocinitomicaceae bacterium]
MRIILLSSAFLISFFGSTQQSFDFFETADGFFKKYCLNGKVDYENIQSDTTLPTLIKHIESDAIPIGDEKAYLINVYNLFVINQVAKKYPIESPMDDPSFFTKKYMILHGKTVSLNHLENEILRKKYSDPRLHFVLVCGAIGCPPIVNFAYRTSMLEKQMDIQTKKALNNTDFLYQKADEKIIYLSEIFNWYKSDFGKSTSEVINYINTFRNNPFDATYRIKYYPYNWTLNGLNVAIPNSTNVNQPPSENINLQQFTAGSLLAKGKMDFTLFNTMYTESRQNWLGDRFSGYRTTFITHQLQWTIGTTKNKRINLGFDLSFRYSGNSSDSTIGGIKTALGFKNTDSSRVGLTSAGIRLKVQPFKNVSDFSIQSTFLIPTISHPEGKSATNGESDGLYWADWNRYTWWNQLFYTKSFGNFQLFTEADLLFRFRSNKSQIGMLDLPISAFLSYFPTKKITVYAMTQHVHRFTNGITPNDPVVTDWVIPSSYTASGLGFKYQLLSNLNIELLYTNFWRSRNAGLGSTFNIGLKFLTR